MSCEFRLGMQKVAASECKLAAGTVRQSLGLELQLRKGAALTRTKSYLAM